jgi:hypothetical protein
MTASQAGWFHISFIEIVWSDVDHRIEKRLQVGPGVGHDSQQFEGRTAAETITDPDAKANPNLNIGAENVIIDFEEIKDNEYRSASRRRCARLD